MVADDHYLDANCSNNTLQHYLNKSEKYFASHNQLIFLPGKHHLYTDLVVHNVQNLTLQGLYSKEISNTIIYCTRSAHVLINSSVDIAIKYMSVNNCGVSQENDSQVPLVTLHSYNCSNIVLLDSVFVCQYQQCGLVVANYVGSSYLTNITSSYLLLTHSMTRNNSDIVIWNYHHMGHPFQKYRAIEILLYEHLYLVKLFIVQTKLSLDKAVNITSSTSKGVNVIRIIKMELTGITVTENVHVVAISVINSDVESDIVNVNWIYFEECLFTYISSQHGQGILFTITDFYGFVSSHFYIRQCRFTSINSTVIIRAYAHGAALLPTSGHLTTFISNTTFSMLKDADFVLLIKTSFLMLIGPVVFTKIVNHGAIIHLVKGLIVIQNHITFSLNQASYCLVVDHIKIDEPARLDIIANNFSVVIYADNDRDKIRYRCLFQYHMLATTTSKTQNQVRNYLIRILFKGNIGGVIYNKRYSTSHCEWINQLRFPQSDPLEVNKNHPICQQLNGS